MIDYHLHTARCGHARGQPAEYYREACRKGLVEVGFADHFPLGALDFVPPVKVTMEEEELPDYIQEVRELREMPRDKGCPGVKLGIEIDYLPGREEAIRAGLAPHDFDYVLGSVHFLGGWDFTNPDLEEDYGRFREEELFQVYEDYYKTVEKGVSSGLYDIVGHLDVIKKFNYRPRKDTWPLVDKVIDLLAQGDMCIELNTAGFYVPAREFYPAARVLQGCLARKVPVTLGSDAHAPGDVGRDFPRALALLREVGYREIAVFKQRKRSAWKI